MADIGKVFPTTNGVWSATTTYERMCIVSYQDSSYISTVTTTGDDPDKSSNWQLIANGIVGPAGPMQPLNYLSKYVVPINLWTTEIANTDLNDDGSFKSGSLGQNKGYGYTSVVPDLILNDGKFHQTLTLYSGSTGETVKLFFYKSITDKTVFNSMTFTVDDEHTVFKLDKFAPTGTSMINISYSNVRTGKPALYNDYVDCGFYVAPLATDDDQLMTFPVKSPLNGNVRVIKRDHTWYIRGDFGGYTQSDAASQALCDLPFSTDLITFKGSGDSGGSPVLVIFGNQLSLQKTVGTGGTVRFSWSIPEELL
ncbi:hypothetical protein [Furfurilactobacillus rossiae]|uniref:Uncharacterized protein n=1 Tax=Furfurilactobacillus rossiae DSM 15814 TaxID=1114972 RepID=A0A0R1RJ59_9LACO|nr:hypothetical protein [Furfurilactobacillus rossiae]KRL56684.1 hypothetical protein FD35_GL001783 [Furfurilactobacillus rossiae DSM 15814]QFR66415.1 hypothetical protein LR814_04610 [Furfurilactobacillus rossiae]QLE61871.1 hypothetical protein LROSRS0_1826 [Furfurilactobacillus rossiae]